MKRIIFLLCLTIIVTAIYAESDNPFIGEWRGNAPGYEFNIVFMYSNTCIITVKTVQDGNEISEEANGTWSYDDNIIRINGSFPKSKIKGLSYISWISVYSFNNNDDTAFYMMIVPPGADRQARISFTRIIKWS